MKKTFSVYVSPLDMDSPLGRLTDLPMEQEKLNGLLLELNLLACKLAELTPWQNASFEGLVRMDLDKGMEELPLNRLIDLANSVDCCHVVAEAGNDEQLGRFYVDNDFPVVPAGLPEEVYELLDYGAIGRKTRQEEGGVFTSGGYVVQHRDLDVSYSQSQNGPNMEVGL